MSSKALKPRTHAEGAGAISPLASVVEPVRSALDSADLKLDARAERDELRRVLNTMDLGFWDWDIPSSAVWYSDHILTLAGYGPEDVVSAENFFQRGLHPEDEPDVSRAMQAVLTGKTKEFRQEFRYRHKQGHWLWFECTGTAVIRTDEGVALRLFGQLTYIDDLKQQQADAAFLVDLMDAMHSTSDAQSISRLACQRLGEYLAIDRVNIGNYDVTARVMTVETEWLSGQSPSILGRWPAAPGDTWFDEAIARHAVIFTHDARPTGAACEGDFLSFHERMRGIAFVRIPLVIEGDIRATLVVSQATPRHWQPRERTLIKDVAERLWDAILRARAEEKRRASQDLLVLALQIAKMGAVQKVIDSDAVTTNANFLEVLGHPDLLSLTAEDYIAIVHPEDRQRVIQRVKEIRKAGEEGTFTDEHRIITADDKIRHIALVLDYRPKFDAVTGAALHSAVVIRDITEQRQREIAAERTREQVDKSSRLSAMGVMASTLAHELTQPLTTAANYLSVMDLMLERDGGCDLASLRDFSKRARDKVLETGETIRRIRSFTVSGEVEAQPTPLRALVFKALSGLFGNAVADGMAISNTVPTGLQVNVDALQIEHVISNLVRNAKDVLADRSDGRIRISAQQNGDMALLLISDNGPGMPDAVAADIFSPFMTSKDQGMGLGLAICRTMVEANGGKISLKDHGPSGTVFSITLPLVDSDQNRINLKG
jgi:PAS domain S-box-containing protein